MDVRGEQVDVKHGVDAPRASRRFVSDVLVRWGVAAVLVERAQLLVSELVSNAFQYGHGPIRIAVEPKSGASSFRVEVCNTGRGHPAVRHPAADEISGRGLHIVDQLSASWGSVTDRGTTSVWFEMHADAAV
jgi:anti-sigma regulatory factor (Ser/Thr protein kinase)